MIRLLNCARSTSLFVINGHCCTCILLEMHGGMDHGIPYRRPSSASIIYVCYVWDTVRVIDEHRTKETRIMNIQAVPSTPDNHPAMSFLGTFHCPALPSAYRWGTQHRWLIDERRGHKETGVIRRCNVFSENYKRSSHHPPIGNDTAIS